MKKNYWKMVFRTVKGSFSRFLAIFLITALGVGFLVGLLCTSPDIRSSVDDYYDEHNLFDLDIKGTMGMTAEDRQTMAERPEVEAVTGIYQKDVLAENPNGQSQVVRLHAGDYVGEAEKMVNTPTLEEGRFPEKAGECVLLKTPTFSGSLCWYTMRRSLRSTAFACMCSATISRLWGLIRLSEWRMKGK